MTPAQQTSYRTSWPGTFRQDHFIFDWTYPLPQLPVCFKPYVSLPTSRPASVSLQQICHPFFQSRILSPTKPHFTEDHRISSGGNKKSVFFFFGSNCYLYYSHQTQSTASIPLVPITKHQIQGKIEARKAHRIHLQSNWKFQCVWAWSSVNFSGHEQENK